MAQHTLQHEIGKKKPFESAAEEAYLNVLRTAATLEGDILPLLKAHGLSESSYNALRILRGHSPAGCPCGVVGEQMVVRVPDVTRLLDRLEQAGLVMRERDTVDRRVVIAKITKKGLDTLAQLDRPLIEAHNRQLAHMTKAELSTLSALLLKARQRPASPTT
jgi:DNA-binding MarR family transcriptional regulator